MSARGDKRTVWARPTPPGGDRTAGAVERAADRLRGAGARRSARREQPMKVCHYVERESFVSGGIETSIRHQRKALSDADVAVTTDPWDDYDVLHLNVLGPGSMFHLLRAKRRGIPVVVHTHTTREDFEQSMRFSNTVAPLVDHYTRRVYSAADLLIAPSEYTHDRLREKGITTDVRVVTNGLDAGHLDVAAQRERAADDGFTVMNLGFVFERKGLSDFVAVGESLSETDFVWYGPQLNGVLQSGAAKRKMKRSPSNVAFPGFIEDINDAFAEADVFFFPTREENEGISMLEAAYCRKPIVVRDIPTYEHWDDDVHCLKCETRAEFENAIERLRADPELRWRLGENARELAEDHTLDAVRERLVEVYGDLADSEGSTVTAPAASRAVQSSLLPYQAIRLWQKVSQALYRNE
ncbi:MAG: glycosyltransferase family 4 protein [Haloarculaceae archaeon]